MKPLHPAVKWPLAIIISGIVLIPPTIKAFGEDPETARIKEYGAQADRIRKEIREKYNTQNNNR